MTAEQYKRLQPFETNFRQAIYSHYVRMSQGELSKVAEVYYDMYHTKISKQQMTCSSCVLRMLSRIGQDYLEYQEWYNKRYNKGNKSAQDSNPVDNQ